MNKLIVVNFKDGKQIKLDPKQIVSTNKMTIVPNESDQASDKSLDFLTQIDLSSNSSDYFTESESILMDDYEDDDDDDEDEDESQQSGSSCDIKPKKKRQRLTHLTEEEKLARRKMKNRVAAQSARDRKKAKMDGLEEESKVLREQNEKLRNENKLLKEKTKLLIDENRKLLNRLKQSSPVVPASVADAQVVSIVRPVEAAALSPRVDSNSVISLKRKFDQMKPTRGVEESAAFSINVSQQKKQLHSLFPQLIYTLIFYTMNLLKSEQATLNSLTRSCPASSQHKSPSSLHQIRAVNLKVLKLKATLVKLLKLLKLHRNQQTPRSAMADNSNKLMLMLPSPPRFRANQSSQQSNICNTILLASLIAKLTRRSKSKRLSQFF